MFCSACVRSVCVCVCVRLRVCFVCACVFFLCVVCVCVVCVVCPCVCACGWLGGLIVFFCGSALRVPPAETRLTVYRRLEIERSKHPMRDSFALSPKSVAACSAPRRYIAAQGRVSLAPGSFEFAFYRISMAAFAEN